MLFKSMCRGHGETEGLVAVVAVLLAMAAPSAAQLPKIQCEAPARGEGACVSQLGRSPAEQIVTVKVIASDGATPVPSVRVRFTASMGWITDSVTTNAAGDATALWYGPSDSGAVRILAVAQIGGAEIRRGILLRMPKEEPRSAFRLKAVHGERTVSDTSRNRYDYWYVEQQLSKPVMVEIIGASERSQCESALVIFRQTSGGGQTPDSAYGTLLDRSPYTRGGTGSMCIARARWKLGKEVGEHHLRATLAGESVKSVEFTAKARARPRLVAGLAFTTVSGFDQLSQSDRKFTVKRTTSTGEISFDSVAKVPSLSNVNRQAVFTPTLGVDWPLKTSWPNVRVSMSASIKNADQDWFAGFSILQAVQGLVHESVGIDLQAVVQLSRRRVVTNARTCAADLATCVNERQTLPVGGGIMLTFDTGLLSLLKDAFGLK